MGEREGSSVERGREKGEVWREGERREQCGEREREGSSVERGREKGAVWGEGKEQYGEGIGCGNLRN